MAIVGGAVLLAGCPTITRAPDSQDQDSVACAAAGGQLTWSSDPDGGARVCITEDAGVAQSEDLEGPADASHD
jgi:hypothetical protein